MAVALLVGAMFATPFASAQALGSGMTSRPSSGTSTAPTSSAETVVVIGTRLPERRFDVPAAVDVVEGEALRDTQARVNLSDVLGGVPGLVAQNRQNYAQDLQISSRGFGARSAFGVRGVRLIQDGIPITMPDGQGQTALFDMDNARSIEVLRGPFAALYGNSSGGVLHLRTRDGSERPEADLALWGGSQDAWRSALRFSGTAGPVDIVGSVARFDTEGWREHSAARRDTANLKLRWSLPDGSRLSLVGNALRQPDTQDPLGLTQAQWESDPRQPGQGALAADTRKSIDHRQAGLVYERALAGGTLELRAYGGERQVVQFLATPLAFQGPTSSGGVVDLDRTFQGTGVEWRRPGDAQGGLGVVLGLSHDLMSERRRGFVNLGGQPGEPRRDEDDRVRSLDQYVILDRWFGDRFKLSGGVRHSEVRFTVRDDFITAQNPDDSGSVTYRSTSPVIGALWRASASTNLFASVGRGFETPTFAELAYRPGGEPGLNFALRESTSRNAEAGVRSQLGERTHVTLTLFRSDTRNDIVSAGASGGRTVFTNAGRTRRQGAEATLEWRHANGIEAMLAYTHTDARYLELRTAAGDDLAGRRMPGVPRHALHGELRWRHTPSGFSTGLELRALSDLPANDANTAHAPSYEVLHWRAGLEQRFGGWTLREWARVENLTDERYVGSVIVNDANQRFFEPAPGRTWQVGVTLGRRF